MNTIEYLKKPLRMVRDFVLVMLCRCRYVRTLRRIRAYRRGRKIRVMFVCSNSSKWKNQSVYEAMLQSEIFDPYVVLTHPSDWVDVPESQLVEMMNQLKSFFIKKDVRVLVAYSANERKPIPYSVFNPDIVFFQEPWAVFKNQDPVAVSKYALCCYVPYYTQVRFRAEEELYSIFFRVMCIRFTMNEKWSLCFKRALRFRPSNQRFVAVGHPAFDELFKKIDAYQGRKDLIVYAPHFSFSHPRNPSLLPYGTFEWNGCEILKYAKGHPEQKWIFKPHPSLKDRIISSGLMTRESVTAYYEEWEKKGGACYDGDYQDMFARSRAMVTDCSSFLNEFGVTGMPIIRLMPSCGDVGGAELSKQYLDTYYEASNLDEMNQLFIGVLENGEDPRREERISALTSCGLFRNNASQRIVQYLSNLVK